MTNITHQFTVIEEAGERLDKFLTAHLPSMSRSRLQALIAQGQAFCLGQTITDANYKVKPGQVWTLTVPEAAPSYIEPQEMPLDIVYEDAHLLVINKPAGLTVHPAPGHRDGTLVNALLAHCGDSLSGIGGVMRPGIVHRLDKETSGLMAVAKHDKAHQHLSEQLSSREMKRTYAAVVWGSPKPAAGTVTGNIGRSPKNRQKMAVVGSGGKPATTHYKVIAPLASTSLVECNLETGRTHQIRVHLAHIGHALVGDPVYGRKGKTKIDFPRQALHAKALGLVHPESGKKMEFTCDLPDDMKALIETLK